MHQRGRQRLGRLSFRSWSFNKEYQQTKEVKRPFRVHCRASNQGVPYGVPGISDLCVHYGTNSEIALVRGWQVLKMSSDAVKTEIPRIRSVTPAPSTQETPGGWLAFFLASPPALSCFPLEGYPPLDAHTGASTGATSESKSIVLAQSQAMDTTHVTAE